jgi:O-antigen ligase
VTLAVLGAILVVALNGSRLLTRAADTSVETDLRLDINRGTLSAIGENPLVGTGLGTFKYVYAPYQPPSEGKFVDRAHDDYLENILELGIPAGIVFCLVPVLLVWECLRGVIRRRRNAIFPCLALGASVLVGSQSAVDFSMQAPAVAITFAALLGVGVAQSRGSSGRSVSNGSLQGVA